MLTQLTQSRPWRLLCSLKLTIVLASAATLLVIGGSLVMPGHPELFSGMDGMPLGTWLSRVARRAPMLTWWVPAGAALLLLLAVNAFCCFIDWALVFRSRWRKSGEYLIHLGFILLAAAYLWGSLAGQRSEGNRLLVGQTLPLQQPGLALRLEAFEPVPGPGGRPMDMINSLVLLKNGTEVARTRARINHPLTWKGLVVLPASYGRAQVGSRPAAPGSPFRQPVYQTFSVLTINYDPGIHLALAGGLAMGGGVLLALFSFYRKRARGDRPEVH